MSGPRRETSARESAPGSKRGRAVRSTMVAAVLPVLVACSAPRASLPAIVANDPAGVLAALRSREDHVISLRAQFTAATEAQGSARSADGVLLVKKPDAFRLRLFLPFGLTLFDYVSVGNRVQLTLPMEGRIVNAPPTGDIGVFSQRDLGQAFLRGEWAYPTPCRAAWEGNETVTVECGDGNGFHRRLEIEARTATVREEISYENGVERLVMQFADYRSVAATVLPFRIALREPQRDLGVAITIRDYEVNPELRGELFLPVEPWAEDGAGFDKSAPTG